MTSRFALLALALAVALVACDRAPPPAPAKPVHHTLGASAVTPLAPSTTGVVNQYDSQGFINSDVIKASPGGFLGAMGYNKGGSTLYLMWFNTTSVPSNGAIPAFMPIPVPSGGTFSLIDTQPHGGDAFGPSMATGLCWAASTTAATLTVDASNSMWLTVHFY